ncbi:MAG: hypothetical protein HS120_11210 [Burkholderiales bacterium]|nr:hypothetical protein [Burkholderiales bacterium]
MVLGDSLSAGYGFTGNRMGGSLADDDCVPSLITKIQLCQYQRKLPGRGATGLNQTPRSCRMLISVALGQTMACKIHSISSIYETWSFIIGLQHNSRFW